MSIVRFAKKLVWSQIKEMYPNEWVLLADVDWPANSVTPKRAIVLSHGPNRKSLIESQRKVKKQKNSDQVLLYVSSSISSVIEHGQTGLAA